MHTLRTWLAPALLLCGLAFADPLVVHISPHATRTPDGTRAAPFHRLEEARDFVRTLRTAHPERTRNGVNFILQDGHYALHQTIEFDARDGGTDAAPVRWIAAPGAIPALSGAHLLPAPNPVTDESTLNLLPPAARAAVVQYRLETAPTNAARPLVLGGFASGRGFRSHAAPELLFNGKPMPRSRSRDAYRIRHVREQEDPIVSHGLRGSTNGTLGLETAALQQWAREPALWTHGYWFWDWADSYEKVRTVDTASQTLTLEPPLHRYGFRTGQPFHVVNAVSEIDEPGEWMMDEAGRRILFWPPSDPSKGRAELSALAGPAIRINCARHLRLEGLVLESGAGDGLVAEDCTRVDVRQVVVRNFGGDGILVRGGFSNRIEGCTVHDLGRGAIQLDGGDRKTLRPGSHRVESCRIYAVSRVDRTYTPGVRVGGVGHIIIRNEFFQMPSSALRVGGNDHRIEQNHLHHVVTESDDQGGVDMWGDPTIRGVVFKANRFNDIGSAWNGGSEVKLGQAAIRLDDAISGVRIESNHFERCGSGQRGFGAIQIHGGKDNEIVGNTFLDCPAAVSFTPWKTNRWEAFIQGRMEKGDIDPVLYRARYPALVDLADHPNRTYVRDNAVRNGELFRRPHSAVIETNNRISAATP